MDDRADNRADVLMLSGIVRVCSDCGDERIFVSIDECEAEGCEFCCTSCGAAMLIDPLCDVTTVTARRVA
jgi:hypothetical protein